jgi:peptidoglycan/LPS O-acetylase OafA/YrhL
MTQDQGLSGESPIDSIGRDRPVTKRVASTYRGDIDGLRALAVGLVVLFHASPNCLPGGFIGVDIFFVISGYLITGIILPRLEQQQFSYLEFFGRRIRRIGPALVVVLLASVAMGSSVSSYPDLRTLGLQVSAASAFSANLLLWSQSGYFDGVVESKPLLHLWSLGVEEQFYLVWPALMASAAVLLARWWVVVLSIVILSFIANVALIDIYPDATFYLLPGRLWELGLGGSLAWYRRSWPFISDPLRANIEAWLGLGLIVSSAIFFNEYLSFPGWWAAGPTVGAMLVIDAGPEAWANRRVL